MHGRSFRPPRCEQASRISASYSLPSKKGNLVFKALKSLKPDKHPFHEINTPFNNISTQILAEATDKFIALASVDGSDGSNRSAKDVAAVSGGNQSYRGSDLQLYVPSYDYDRAWTTVEALPIHKTSDTH
jgi:hypothetical protein